MARGRVYRKDGRWAYRVDAGVHPGTDKRRQISRQAFATKRAAENALSDAIGEVNRGTLVSRSTMTVGEYLEE